MKILFSKTVRPQLNPSLFIISLLVITGCTPTPVKNDYAKNNSSSAIAYAHMENGYKLLRIATYLSRKKGVETIALTSSGFKPIYEESMENCGVGDVNENSKKICQSNYTIKGKYQIGREVAAVALYAALTSGAILLLPDAYKFSTIAKFDPEKFKKATKSDNLEEYGKIIMAFTEMYPSVSFDFTADELQNSLSKGRETYLFNLLFEKNNKLITASKNPSYSMLIKGLKVDPNYIKNIENQTEELQLIAIEGDPSSLEYMKNPTEKIQMLAVKKNGSLIKHITQPSERVQSEAVKNYTPAIKYIKNPTEAVQLLAISQDAELIEYIENPTEDAQLSSVLKNKSLIKYIKNPTEKTQLIAVTIDPFAIKYITEPTEKVQLRSVLIEPSAVQLIRNPSENVQLALISGRRATSQEINNYKSIYYKVKKYITKKTNQTLINGKGNIDIGSVVTGDGNKIYK